MRQLPDPALSARDAIGFIFDSAICRSALEDPNPRDLAVLVQDVLDLVRRLEASCHLPEFTDHGFVHLCSLFQRINTWTTYPKGEALLSKLDAAECAVLLLAVLFHDIGMLSQRADDLPKDSPEWLSKGLHDVPDWVRRTHVARIRGLVTRGLKNRPSAYWADTILERAFTIAESHEIWPWASRFKGMPERDQSLAAILAIVDLLDEDSGRCDTRTLIDHREGTELNRAHWIRHAMTADRIAVMNGEIRVRLLLPPRSLADQLDPVFEALRNHFRLVELYRANLAAIGAEDLRVVFDPLSGVPKEEAREIAGWNLVNGFATTRALAYHLLSSFSSQALLDDEALDAATMSKLRSARLESVDLSLLRSIRGSTEVRSSAERLFAALE